MAQIEIKNLTFTYSGEDKPAIRDISVKVERGDFVVLCGKSGCGKSTLLRNIKPVIRPFGESKGEVLFCGQNIEKVPDRIQAEKIGFVMQNPDNQIVTDKVWHELAFGLENLGYKTAEIRLRVAEMAEYFGITDWYYKSVDKLSGGQKQLLNLAAVMAMHPEVIILDEPTAQLDPIAAEKFLTMLKKINRDLGITIILSEHRLNCVIEEADRVLLMDEGSVLYYDTPKNVMACTMDSEQLKLMPVSAQIFKEYIEAKKIRDEDLNNIEVPMSVEQGRKWLDTIGVSGAISIKETQAADSVVICKNLWFRYERNGNDIIKGLNLTVNKGEIFAILGGNGTGKTTTLSLLCGVNKPCRGKIKIEGKVSALQQNVQTLFLKDSVGEELEGVPDEIIEQMELSKVRMRHPYDISGGQQQKVALAKVLAKNPDILLLDEPTKGIDGIYKENLGKILLELKEIGKTIIIVSHDTDFCGQFADRCGLFAQGSLIAVSNFREFFSANRFYTTTVSKMAGDKIKGAVNREDVICFLREGNIT